MTVNGPVFVIKPIAVCLGFHVVADCGQRGFAKIGFCLTVKVFRPQISNIVYLFV